LEEMDVFVNAFDVQKLNREDINHLNRIVKSNEIETLIEFAKNKCPG
jgi:hypothetical protein